MTLNARVLLHKSLPGKRVHDFEQGKHDLGPETAIVNAKFGAGQPETGTLHVFRVAGGGALRLTCDRDHEELTADMAGGTVTTVMWERPDSAQAGIALQDRRGVSSGYPWIEDHNVQMSRQSDGTSIYVHARPITTDDVLVYVSPDQLSASQASLMPDVVDRVIAPDGSRQTTEEKIGAFALGIAKLTGVSDETAAVIARYAVNPELAAPDAA